LALARAERTQGARPGRLELDEALQERAAAWQPLATERNISIVANAGGLKGRCTSDMLSQVLDNLIANALEVAPADSVLTLQATTEDSSSGSIIAVHVIDQGPGLSDEQRERAFSPSFRNWWNPKAAELSFAPPKAADSMPCSFSATDPLPQRAMTPATVQRASMTFIDYSIPEEQP
jgi:K+-sensing histidine kinase KdpD